MRSRCAAVSGSRAYIMSTAVLSAPRSMRRAARSWVVTADRRWAYTSTVSSTSGVNAPRQVASKKTIPHTTPLRRRGTV
jgi:hypothetical protein